MTEINGVRVPFIPIVEQNSFQTQSIKNSAGSFDEIFNQELEKVKFSSHAMKRLESRNIQFSETDMNKIQAAVERAEMKGSKDSLVMVDDTALIVNIPNKTVVTAMQVSKENENVFTNIDSVVFA
jgi:flagellar operon protein